ncbi:MAG: DUF5615 family PIN-like protein [Bacteroidota bacterium]|nr:DUF5615 family PIN-like protein [Bacteroidota bacterium]
MSQFSFLVDVNLPKYFSFFNSSNFYFVSDIDPEMTDLEIWDYALENNLVIMTKDTDFYDKCILNNQCPIIIHFRIGNLSLKEMYIYFEKNWNKIQSLLSKSKMIIAHPTFIEVIEI